MCKTSTQLQQYLPFTVLKRNTIEVLPAWKFWVATVLTVYGIETLTTKSTTASATTAVATVLTVYGIETYMRNQYRTWKLALLVATVLTVYGIETA